MWGIVCHVVLWGLCSTLFDTGQVFYVHCCNMLRGSYAVAAILCLPQAPYHGICRLILLVVWPIVQPPGAEEVRRLQQTQASAPAAATSSSPASTQQAACGQLPPAGSGLAGSGGCKLPVAAGAAGALLPGSPPACGGEAEVPAGIQRELAQLRQ